MTPLLAVDISRPVLPAWAVFPVAFLAMFVLAGHILALWKSEMPASRRRIRMFSSMLMLLATPLIAWATAVLVPETQPRPWVLAWTAITGLLCIVLLIAIIDMANNYRIAARDRAEARRQLREAQQRVLEDRIRGREAASPESGR